MVFEYNPACAYNDGSKKTGGYTDEISDRNRFHREQRSAGERVLWHTIHARGRKFPHDSEIIVDPIQGGAGTSLNMNVNEVLANRAIELLGGIKGDYKRVHPNDHINMSQSTNDVFPTAGKIAACRLVQKAEKELRRLHKALEEKSVEFYPVIKMGRTQLQDAVPIRLGQEFASYAAAVGRDIRRMETAAGKCGLPIWILSQRYPEA